MVLSAIVVVGASAASASESVVHLGAGASEVWIFRPDGQAKSIVIFGHGWSTPFPAGFGPWVAHLRSRGNIVIYPRYRVRADDSAASALAAFRRGITTAFGSIRNTRVPVIAVGKSFGGSAIFYYAAEAQDWRVPAPSAVLSIFPALPIGPLPSSQPAQSTFVEIFVGDADTTAGSAGANAFFRWLARHRSDRKRFLVIHSRPGFVANHDAPQRTDVIARAVFWRPLDVLVARARADRRR